MYKHTDKTSSASLLSDKSMQKQWGHWQFSSQPQLKPNHYKHSLNSLAFTVLAWNWGGDLVGFLKLYINVLLTDII